VIPSLRLLIIFIISRNDFRQIRSKYTKKYENAITFSEKDAFYSKEITYYYKELNLAKPSH